MKRISEINNKIPNTHLVMHGSSSVPKELIDKINNFGGKIKETYGVPINEIKEGIKSGVRKINVDTDLRLASTAAIREYLFNNPADFDPRKYLQASKNAMKEIVKNRFIEFGSADKASNITPISLEKMSKTYVN